jgi:dCMP deaminase
MPTNWDERFIALAAHVSKWSKDPSTKIGAVITRGKFIVSVGFNGHPAGIEDSEVRLNDREVKYKTVIHAEENAILSSHSDLRGCSIYITMFPCSHCAARIIQTSITRVIAPRTLNERWIDSSRYAAQILKEAGVELVIL